MSSYIKAASIVALGFLYAFFGYLYWGSKPVGGEDRAFLLFKEKEYHIADALVEELQKFSSAPNYTLYHAYILRAKNQLVLSDDVLDRSLKRSKLEKNKKLVPEIYYNIALNAYLENDAAKLKAVIDKMRDSVRNIDNQWLRFFVGLEMHLKGNDAEATMAWEHLSKLKHPSPWMALAFETYFSDEWFELRFAKAEIEKGEFEKAKNRLEAIAKADNIKTSSEANFLLGLTSVEHALNLPHEEALPHYDQAVACFEKSVDSVCFFQHELGKIYPLLEELILGDINRETWNEFSTHLVLFQKLASQDHLKLLSKKLLSQFEMNPVAKTVVKQLNGDAFGAMRHAFSDILDERLAKTLKEGQFELFKSYWELQGFLSDHHAKYVESVSESLRSLIVKSLEKDDNTLSRTRSMSAFWQTIEQNPRERLLLAIQMVRESERLWYTTKEYDKIVHIFKLAYDIPAENEKKYIHKMIDEAALLIYQRAVNEDQVAQYFPIFHLVKALNLPSVDLANEEEIAYHIADAEYLQSKSRIQEAKIKASWVLTVDPSNRQAKKILEKFSQGTNSP